MVQVNYRKHDQVEVAKSVLLPDGKTLFLVIPSMKPAEQMSIRYTLKFADSTEATGEIINTVHKLGKHLDDEIAKYEETGNKTPENLKAGLQQTITHGDKIDHRISRLAAQFNAADDAVSDMLGKNEGAYTSQWSGYLDLKERKTVKFSFEGHGTVALKIDGKVVLSEQGSFGAKQSESMQIDPGAHAFELNYIGAKDGSGHVRLMWEGKDFPVKSVASSFFKHQSNDALSKALSLRHGRDILTEQNCASCHNPEEDLSFPELAHQGPDMKGIGSRVSEQWLASWLASPHSVKPGTTMPAIVDGNTEQGRKDAADMAAYLASLSAEKVADKAVSANDVKVGGAHFHNLGCIACHSLPTESYNAESGRTALNRVSQKYSQSSLATFLKKPDANHASIKMPDFGLSDDEAHQIAAFLRSASKGKAPAEKEFVKGDAVRGAKLVATNNCAECHSNLPNENAKLPSLKAIFTKSWSEHGCVPATTPGKTPVLNISNEERALLEGFRSHYAKEAETTLSVASSHDFSRRQVEALNCAYMGEMLHSDYMEEILDGKLDQRPRPWLSMRMPAFHSRASMLTKGLAGQHGMAPSKVDVTNLDAEKIKIGEKIVGSNGGFACIICHGAGKTKPLAAFEVEGINFDQVARRLRPGYYHNWMENPQSITPTTKMPRYATGNKSALPDYGNDARKQYEAVSEYLKSLEAAK